MRIAEIIGWLLASVGFVTALVWVYHVSMAILAHALGAVVERVSLGLDVGGYGLRWRGKRWEWCLGILPFGGYTKLLGFDEALPQDDDLPCKEFDEPFVTDRFGRKLMPGSFLSLAPLSRMCIVLLGPLSAAFMALVVLLLPVILSAPQMRLCSAAETELDPVAVSGLSFADQPSTVMGQLKLTRNIAWQTMRRVLFLAPRDGWGGLIAYLAMCVAAGLHSPAAWLTCVGVFGLIFSLINLLPSPTLIGAQALEYLAEAFGFLWNEATRTKFLLVGLLLVLLLFARMLWLDAAWLWEHVARMMH